MFLWSKTEIRWHGSVGRAKSGRAWSIYLFQNSTAIPFAFRQWSKRCSAYVIPEKGRSLIADDKKDMEYSKPNLYVIPTQSLRYRFCWAHVNGTAHRELAATFDGIGLHEVDFFNDSSDVRAEPCSVFCVPCHGSLSAASLTTPKTVLHRATFACILSPQSVLSSGPAWYCLLGFILILIICISTKHRKPSERS